MNVLDKLPTACLVAHPSCEKDCIVLVFKGTVGHLCLGPLFPRGSTGVVLAKEINANEGISDNQVAAMTYGLIHGWDHPMVDPDNPLHGIEKSVAQESLKDMPDPLVIVLLQSCLGQEPDANETRH